MNTEHNEYVLGTNDAELIRLGLQHRLWAGAACELWERAGFQSGMTVLDLGSGPGYATLDLAQLVGPAGRVLAVDASSRFIEYLRSACSVHGRNNVDARVADVEQLNMPPDSLDAAYSRWVLCFLKQPEEAVARVARALRPDGVFTVQDYFNYRSLTLAPRSDVFDRIVAAVDASWRHHGGDPDICGRLPAIMARCGLEVREIRPILRVARPGSLLWQWPTTFFMNFVPKLVHDGFVSESDYREFERIWAERTQSPDTFFVTPPVFDIIAVKR